MSKNRFLLRAILKGVIAILAAANLVALFGFNYEIPGLSSALSRVAVFGSSSAGSSGSVDGSSAGGSGSSDGSDADDSSSGSAESETISSDDSTSDETESDVDVLNAEVSGEASGEAGNAANEENDETIENTENIENIENIENTENVSESADASASSESTDGAADSGLVITVAEDLPAFSSSELSLLVDLLIDQNLIRAEDGSGNDITYDIVAEIADGDSEDERIVTFRVTDEEGESTSTTAVIQVTD